MCECVFTCMQTTIHVPHITEYTHTITHTHTHTLTHSPTHIPWQIICMCVCVCVCVCVIYDVISCIYMYAHVRVFGWVGGCVRVRVSVCVSVARRVARRSSLSNEPYSHIPSPCVHRLSVRVVRRSSMTHCSSWCLWGIQMWVKQRCSRDLWTTISAIT